MLCHFGIRGATASLALILGLWSVSAQADPLFRNGIGLTNCAKLAPALNPSEGLDNTANALVYYWDRAI